MSIPPLALALPALCSALLAGSESTTAPPDTVDHASRIGSPEIGTGLQPGAGFGTALAHIGDLNGDGTDDLAVGAPWDGPGKRRGALWILFLNPDQSVKSTRQLTAGRAGFRGPLADNDRFGAALAFLGDLDGDGRPELAVGAPYDGPGQRGAVWMLSLNRDGSVHAQHRIAPEQGGFEGQLGARDAFGSALAAPGDLDGDGTPDLVVGAPYSASTEAGMGSVWILGLSSAGTVRSTAHIQSQPGSKAGFGFSVASAGDLDGDGRPELAIGAPLAGEVWIAFLDTRAHVRRRVAIHLDPNRSLAPPSNPSQRRPSFNELFGAALAPCGDIDGDGTPDLAVGLPKNRRSAQTGTVWLLLMRPDGSVRARESIGPNVPALANEAQRYDGFARALASTPAAHNGDRRQLIVGAPDTGPAGTIWNLSLGGCFSPSVALRDGYGVNPHILRSTSAPQSGRQWNVELNCAGHAPGIALVMGSSTPASGILTGAGEVLINLAPGHRIFTVATPHAGNVQQLQTTLPRDVSFCNFAVYVQGTCSDATRSTLSNALDLVLGH